MTFPRFLGALALVAGLAACSDPAVTRNTPAGPGGLFPAASTQPEVRIPSYRVDELRVWVPHEMVVAEATGYFPLGDILWSGDPPGDRREQVRSVLEEGLQIGARDLATAAERADGSGTDALPSVVIEAELTRFHALSPVARSTLGGLHTIAFVLTVRDATSGEILDGPRTVRMDIPASGGARARQEDSEGLTQRVVITRHIGSRLVEELSVPDPVDEPAVISRLADGPRGAMVQALR